MSNKKYRLEIYRKKKKKFGIRYPELSVERTHSKIRKSGWTSFLLLFRCPAHCCIYSYMYIVGYVLVSCSYHTNRHNGHCFCRLSFFALLFSYGYCFVPAVSILLHACC